MANIGITRMSSKGQIVIPQDMREGILEGEKLVIIQSEDQLILKKASEVDSNFKEDLEFARRTEEAYKQIEAGNSFRVKLEDLDKVMDSW